MDVFWLEQGEADVPRDDNWLSASERTILNAMRFAKRQSDWRLGRWTAKCALSAYLNLLGDRPALASIEIRPAASGAPEVFIADRPAAVSISFSHCNGHALCAIAPLVAALGCDLELIEPRSDAFVTDYFTAEEQALVAQASAADHPCLVTLLWSAKESALKALHEGLRLDTRSVVVGLTPESGKQPCNENSGSVLPQPESVWHPLRVRSTSGGIFHGWWQQAGDLVRTLVSDPAPNSPIALKIPA